MVAAAQEEGAEAQFGAAQVVGGIGAGATDVTHGFVGGVGDVDRLQLARQVEAGEFERVAGVGLDALTRALGNERGGDDGDFQAKLHQPPGEHETGGTGFVADFQRLELRAEAGGEFAQGAFDRKVGRGARAVIFEAAVRPRPSDGNGFGVHVETDMVGVFHGVVVSSMFDWQRRPPCR